MKKNAWIKRFVCILCMALLLPSLSALAAENAPSLTLLCPTNNSANTDGQQLVLRASSPVIGQEGGSISIQAKDNAEAAVYSIACNSEAITVSDSDPYLITIALSALKNGDASFAPAASTAYTVTVSAGAFVSRTDSTPCKQTGADFVLIDAIENGLLVTYALPDGWSVKTVVTDGKAADVACGATVASGTILAVNGTVPEGDTAICRVNGTSVDITGLRALTVTANTHITAALIAGLSGTATIYNADGTQQSGYTPLLGETLACAYTGNASSAMTAMHYEWLLDNAPIAGASAASYTPVEGDVNKSISVRLTNDQYPGSITSAPVTLRIKAATPSKPTVASVTTDTVTLNAVSGCEYSINGTSYQPGPVFADLEAGHSYTFYQRVSAADAILASDPSEGLTVQTASGLTGNVVITGTARAGQTLTAELTETNNTGVVSYTWKKGDQTVSDTETYTVSTADIGSALTVEARSSVQPGVRSATTPIIGKSTATAPAAPTSLTISNNSITLTSVSGCEYSVDNVNWQDSATFNNLVAGNTYTFYQRYKATDVLEASPSSQANISTTKAADNLTGTVNITGTPRAGQTLTAALTGTNNTGSLRYTWKKGNQIVSEAATYTVSTADIGSTLTVEVRSSVQSGIRSAATPVIGKTAVNAPAAPTSHSVSNNSITLNSVSGCEYSVDGVNWQDSTTFNNLIAGSTYTFYQRYKATAMLEASPASQANISTTNIPGSLTGTVTVTGDARYGKTLVATLTGSNNTGTLTYTWFLGATAVGTGSSYDVNIGDIGYPLYVQVISSTQSGGITKLVGTVQRADFIGNTPPAPTRESRSTSRITLKMLSGYEYSKDGENWQSSNVFSGLSAGKTYRFYQRIAATASMEASPASEALKTSTNSSSSSSSSDSSSGSSSGSSTGSSSSSGNSGSGSGNATSGSGALYNYTTGGDSTKLLFSTMERLVTGNKTQDVTITSGNVQFRFFKGTMQLSEGALWYDFGVEINGAELMQQAKAIAGDSVVATVHFNHSGELPAKANIRIALDAAQAGKALYYYRIENSALTYVQTAIADISGSVTVVQSSCSDYVLLDRDFYAADATPSPTPEATPTPTPLMAETTAGENNNKKSGGWLIALIIIVALLLIVAGILFYIKSRQQSNFDADFGDFDDDPDNGGSDDDTMLSDVEYDDDLSDFEDDPLYDSDQNHYAAPSERNGAYGRSYSNSYSDPYAQPPVGTAAQQPYSTPVQSYDGTRQAPYQADTAPQPATATYSPMVHQSTPPAPSADDTSTVQHSNPQDDPMPAENATHHRPNENGKFPRVRYRP